MQFRSFPLSVPHIPQSIFLPKNAQIVNLTDDSSIIIIWVLGEFTDNSAFFEERTFIMVPPNTDFLNLNSLKNKRFQYIGMTRPGTLSIVAHHVLEIFED